MIFTAAGRVNEAEIEQGVRRVEKDFAPEVVRIVHSFGKNHWGDPAVFFRIIVADEVFSPLDRLFDLSRRLSGALRVEARTEENALVAYFQYRTLSESVKAQDPEWN